MVRLILIAVAVAVLVWLVRRALAGPPAGGSADGNAQPPGAVQGELVRCARCDVNLPKTEARSAGGHFYCSEEHWRLGPRDG